jgi:TonB family protein
MRKKVAGEMPRVGGVTRKTTIAVEATVSASGRVTKLSVLQATRNAGLLDRTLTAVRSWRFESLPASRKGAAERCRITLTFRPPG